MEVSYHLLQATTTTTTVATSTAENKVDEAKRKLLADQLNGVTSKVKVLSLHSKPVEALDTPVIESMKSAYTSIGFNASGLSKIAARNIPTSPERILDAPDFRNDYCIYSLVFVKK